MGDSIVRGPWVATSRSAGVGVLIVCGVNQNTQFFRRASRERVGTGPLIQVSRSCGRQTWRTPPRRFSRWSEVELFRVVAEKLAVHPSPDQPPVSVDIDFGYPQLRRRQVLLFVYPARAGV